MPRDRRRSIEVPTDTQLQFELRDTSEDIERIREREEREERERQEQEEGGRKWKERGQKG